MVKKINYFFIHQVHMSCFFYNIFLTYQALRVKSVDGVALEGSRPTVREEVPRKEALEAKEAAT